MRTQNLILFFLLCFGAFLWGSRIDLSQKISLEVLDLFPNTQERKILDLYREVGDSKLILVVKEGPDFEAFLSEVAKLPNVNEVVTQSRYNQILQSYIQKNYFWLGDLVPNTQSPQEIQETLLAQQAQNTLNPLDPLRIIRLPSLDSSLADLAYIRLQDTEASSVHTFYGQFSVLIQKYGIKHYYSPLFVEVENPQLILKEVNTLTVIACIFFALLYLMILRIPFLTFNALVTILSSNLVAILVLLNLYPQVSIMSLSFGIGISNICIDYMMHHHFLGFYTQKKISFNLSVFYGFLTTITGFFVCLFVPFPLLNQLALYAIINLSVAYFCFAFLYQKITFAPPKLYPLSRIRYPILPSWLILIFSLGLGSYGVLHVQREFDLSKLDYQNPEFERQKEFFSALTDKKSFLIREKSIDALLAKGREVAKIDPQSVGILSLLPTRKDVRAREKFFKSFSFEKQKKHFAKALYLIQKHDFPLSEVLRDSYRSQGQPPKAFDLQDLQTLGARVVKCGEQFCFQGRIADLSRLSDIQGLITQQPTTLMQEITGGIYDPMVSILVLALLAILALLFLIAGRRILDCVNFVLFPLACILFYLSFFSLLNIMHLFALLLVVVVGVDYGIYHIREKDDLGAKNAMFFSVLTTLCSFGIFVFSHTRALSSFGEVVSLGMACILILIFLQKDGNERFCL